MRNNLCVYMAKHVNISQTRQQLNKAKMMSSQSESEPMIGNETNQAVNFFKQNQNIAPCLGSGINPRTGRKMGECIFITYEDFQKLINFNSSA